jgi:hypothetical protein
VHMVSALVDEAHAGGVHMRPAFPVISLISGDGPGGHDDQAVSWMRMPAGDLWLSFQKTKGPSDRPSRSDRKATSLPSRETAAACSIPSKSVNGRWTCG